MSVIAKNIKETTTRKTKHSFAKAPEVAETGAKRDHLTGDHVRFDLMLSNGEAMRRLAATWAEGFKKYGPNNWMKGFKSSELINHTMEHLIQYCEGDFTEDHLAHAVWNLMALIWEQKNKPELLDYPIREEGKSPDGF